ncbi:MAG: hypothetical protein MJ113_08200, partial [Lachnospiraceae bacterium]|nr:hypothetical protein [Lachnospiraceae bacterium]
MKKLVPFLLVLMMAVLFAGCGNEEKKDIVPSNTPEISGSETNVPENTSTPTPTIEPTATTKPTATPKPTATSTPTPLSMPDKTLKEVFAEHGMKVGTCIGTNMTNNAKYA